MARLVPGAIRVAGDAIEVRRLAAWLRSACERDGISEQATTDLELAMVEAANNVLQHGYQNHRGEIGLDFSVSAGTARIVLSDKGHPLPPGLWGKRQVPSLDETSGRGLAIIEACVDAIEYGSRGGINRLEMCKRI